MSLIRQLIVIIMIAGAAVAGWSYFGADLGATKTERKKPKGGKKAVTALVRPSSTGVENIRLHVVGTARALRSADLHPPTAGEIMRINFGADQQVAAGDILVELDRESEELAVDLERVRLADAERKFKRLRRLKSKGAVANSTHDDAQSSLEAARIELKRAEVHLADRHVVAPFAGRIGLTEFDVGDRVDADSVIASLDQREVLLVRFEVPEALLGRIKVGDKTRIAPWSDPKAQTQGAIHDVGSRINDRTRTFPVRARIDNPKDKLRPGMSFQVSTEVIGAEYPKVPEIAVQWSGGGSSLWIVTDGVVRQVKATIVQRQGSSILVDADITTGELVVVEGFHRMRVGRKVQASIAPDGAAGS